MRRRWPWSRATTAAPAQRDSPTPPAPAIEHLADPFAIARVFAASPHGPAQWWVRDPWLGYRYDPDLGAERHQDGTWTVEFIERGTPRIAARLVDDEAMSLWLVEHARTL